MYSLTVAKEEVRVEVCRMVLLTHESLVVYQRAIEFVAWSSQLFNPMMMCRVKSKAFLVEIVALLRALARSVAGERVREEIQDYLLDQKT